MNILPDISIYNVVLQGGFAALFLWLLITTQKQARAREDKLTSVLEKFADQLPTMTAILQKMQEQITRIESRLEKQ